MSPRLLPHRLLLKHRLPPLVQLSQAALLRANQRVMSLVKRLARLHHDLTHLVPIRRVHLLVERLAQQPPVAPLARRLVVR